MIKKKILILLTLSTFFLLFQKCKPKIVSKENIITEISKKETTDPITTNSYPRKKIINIKKIDSLQFFSEKDKANLSKINRVQLTNVNEVKNLLKEIIEFEKIDEKTIAETPIKK